MEQTALVPIVLPNESTVAPLESTRVFLLPISSFIICVATSIIRAAREGKQIFKSSKNGSVTDSDTIATARQHWFSAAIA
jgi:hypothetical protein